MLYELPPGIGSMVLTDWHADGRFLTFYAGDVLYISPVVGKGNAIEVVRSEFSAVGGGLSPDGRFVSYLSNMESFLFAGFKTDCRSGVFSVKLSDHK